MCGPQCVLVIALLFGLADSWDIAATTGERIEFYTIDGTRTDAVHFPSQNLTAVAYDEVHDMLLYVDKQNDNDAICGYKMSFQEYECYIERNGRNIQGLAFDPVTQRLFFTDTKERSINWFSFEPGFKNNVFGNLLIKLEEGIPTDIVVDSCRRYIYWINRNITTSTIERARFDGSERGEVIVASYEWDLHSLAIDQQTQKIFWIEPQNANETTFYSADLYGENWEKLVSFILGPNDTTPYSAPNTLSYSNGILWIVDFCSPCNERVFWKYESGSENTVFEVHTETAVGIATNYKMIDQFQGISDCKHVLDNHGPVKIVREHEGPFCVHGVKEVGKSLCKCSPGYIGERCDVTVCKNYCFQGNCSFTEEGLPKCRCYAGYTGERCEVNVCNGYCLNNGICSLNEEDEPVCECTGAYEGERCHLPTEGNNGDGSRVESTCQCVGSLEGSGSDTDTNKTSTNSLYYLEDRERNLTLVDLLDNWRQRARQLP